MAKVIISKGSTEHYLTAKEKAAHCHFIETSEDLYRLILDNQQQFSAMKEIAGCIQEVAERLERTEPIALRIWKVFQESIKKDVLQEDKV